MKRDALPEQRLFAWNGLQFTTPAAWQVRVAALHHLVFEADFQPRLQIRWQNETKLTAASFERMAEDLAASAGPVQSVNTSSRGWRRLEEQYHVRVHCSDASPDVSGGLLLCRTCRTVIHFQPLAFDNRSREETEYCLAHLSCHAGRDAATSLWRLDNFSLTTPATMALTDYTFAAGLTRLSFADGPISLQACTLGRADIRLQQQSLQHLLLTLSGAADLQMQPQNADTTVVGMRSPGFAGRLFFRLRREKPYITASLRHDREANRLLALSLSANRPLPSSLLQTLDRHYEAL